MSDKNDIVIVNLDRPRVLWFGHKALKMLGALTGKSLTEVTSSFGKFDFDDVEKTMYCGLLTDAKAHNEEIKLEDMEDLLDKAPYADIIVALQAGLIASLGGGEEVDGKNSKGIAEKKKK